LTTIGFKSKFLSYKLELLNPFGIKNPKVLFEKKNKRFSYLNGFRPEE